MHPAAFARRVGCLLVLVSLGLPATASAGGGACCFADDLCLDGIDGDDCEAIGGTYLGDGSTCDGDEDGDGVVGCADLCPDTPPGVPVDDDGCPTVGACCFAEEDVCLDLLDFETCSAIGGAYKGNGSSCEILGTCPPLCEGDVNGDGFVDPLDVGFILARFGCSYPDGGQTCLDADVNGDGLVDPLDSGFVAARFGVCVEVPFCDDENPCDDDGLFCNGMDECVDGVCVAGADPCADTICTCDGEDQEPICDEGDTGAVCSCPECPGLEFTLDQDNLIGSTGDDIFSAPLIFSEGCGCQVASLQTGDSANGLAGADTLNATLNQGTNPVVTLTGIENLNFTNFAAETINASNITGAEKIGWVGATANLTVNALANILDGSISGIATAGTTFLLSFQDGATTGSADVLSLAVSDTTTGTFQFITAANGFETLNVDSIVGNANTLTAIRQTTGTTVATINFTGDIDLTVNTVPTTALTIDASSMSGGLHLGAGTEDSTYDEFSNPAADWWQITGGSGDDLLIFEDTLTTTDFSTGTLDLGHGTDVVQNSFAATFGAASKMRNVEEARFNATASGISYNFFGWTGLETISIEEDGTANTFTLTTVPTTSGGGLPTLNFRGDDTAAPQTYDSVTYNAASASGSSDSLTISLGNRGTNLNTGSLTTNEHILGNVPFTVANIETINIDVADGPATFSGLTASTLVTLDVDAPTSNTGTNVTMGTVAATGTTIQTVDASGVTGNFSATIDFAAATITIFTGPGNDTITIGQNSSAYHNSTVTLGDGNDTFTGDMSTAGTDSVTAGTGNDTITAGPGVDTITTGTGQDTINMDNNDTNEVVIDTVTDFAAGVGGDIVKFDVTSLEALDTDGGGADDLVDYATATIAGTETFNINLVTTDGETMVAGDDMAVIDDDLATFANMAAYIAATTATVDLAGPGAFAAEDIVLLAYADGAGNTRIGICGDTGGGGTNTDACDAGEDVLILSGVDVDNLVNGNFSWQP